MYTNLQQHIDSRYSVIANISIIFHILSILFSLQSIHLTILVFQYPTTLAPRPLGPRPPSASPSAPSALSRRGLGARASCSRRWRRGGRAGGCVAWGPGAGAETGLASLMGMWMMREGRKGSREVGRGEWRWSRG